MGKRFKDPATGAIYEVGPDGKGHLVQAPSSAPQSVQVSGPDPTLATERALKAAALARAAQDAARAPAEARQSSAQAANAEQQPTYNRFNAIDKLSDGYRQDKRILTYETALPIFASALTSPESPEADSLLVNAIAKIGDPITGVQQREGDAYQAGSPIYQQVKARLLKEFGDDGSGNFSSEARQRLKVAMRNRMQALATAYNAGRAYWAKRVQDSGIPEANVEAVIGEHFGKGFQQSEANFTGRPITNLDGSQGAAPVDPRAGPRLVSDVEQPGGRSTAAMLRQAQAAFDAKADADTLILLASRFGPVTPDFEAKVRGMVRYRDKGGKGARFLPPDTMPDPTGDVHIAPDTSVENGLIKGLLHPLDRAAVGLQTGVNAVLGTNFDSATRTNAERNAYFEQAPVNSAAETAGNAVGVTPLFLAPGGAFTQGGAAGVLTGESNTPGTVAKDFLVGGLIGKGADMGVRAVAGTVAPQLSASVRKLLGEDVRLTPGKMYGGRLEQLEDLSMSLPQAGPMLTEARDLAAADYARGIGNRVLAPIGERVPKGMPGGHQTNRYVNTRLSDEYNELLPRISVEADPTLATRIAAVQARAARDGLPTDQTKLLTDIIDRHINEPLSAGRVGGRQVKRMDEKLGDLASSYGRNEDPYVRQVGDSVANLRDQVMALTRRQNPAEAEPLRRLNQAWALNARLRDAAAKSVNDGIPTPGELAVAVRTGDRTAGKGATARGDALLQDYAQAGMDVLPSRTGNSGTNDRENLLKMRAWIAGLAVKNLYGPGVQSTIRNVLGSPRNESAEAIARLLKRLPAATVAPALIAPR